MPTHVLNLGTHCTNGGPIFTSHPNGQRKELHTHGAYAYMIGGHFSVEMFEKLRAHTRVTHAYKSAVRDVVVSLYYGNGENGVRIVRSIRAPVSEKYMYCIYWVS